MPPRASRSASVFSTIKKGRSEHPPSPRWRSASGWRNQRRKVETVIASWDRWIRHRPALDECLRLDVGSMTPFLSDFLPRSGATKQSSFLLLREVGLLRCARNDGLNQTRKI